MHDHYRYEYLVLRASLERFLTVPSLTVSPALLHHLGICKISETMLEKLCKTEFTFNVDFLPTVGNPRSAPSVYYYVQTHTHCVLNGCSLCTMIISGYDRVFHHHASIYDSSKHWLIHFH